MKLHKHFLPQDMVQASKEFHSVKDCLKLIDLHLNAGDIKFAEERIKDMLFSLQELSRLAGKKESKSKLDNLLEHLHVKGINAQVVRMIKHE